MKELNDLRNELISFEVFDENEKFVARIVIYDDWSFWVYEAEDCEVIERSPLGIDYDEENLDDSLIIAMEEYLDQF